MSNSTRVIMTDGPPRMFRKAFRLDVIDGPLRGLGLTSAKESTTVGSAEWNDLVLDDPSVSRHHLRIKITADGFLLTDLDSTNGTTSGNFRLGRVLIDGPAELTLGDSRLRFAPQGDEEEVALRKEKGWGELVGQSAPMRELFDQLELLATSDRPALIEGESGSGKSAIAKEVHRRSGRGGPLLTFDCGARGADLAESELFGDEHQPGVLKLAANGSLLLEDVEKLQSALQDKLLDAIKGENATPRLISTTSADILRAVNRGTFSAPLFYALCDAPISVPPLRERKEDLPALIDHLVDELDATRESLAISESTILRLQGHSWPGNLHELREALERLVAHSADVDELFRSTTLTDAHGTFSFVELEQLPFREAKTQLLDYFERRYLSELLNRCENNVTRAARESGIDRVHLYRLLKKHELRKA